MKEFIDLALDVANAAGAAFADMRVVEKRENVIFVERRSLKQLDEYESSGYGVRVLLDGAWGFASSTELNRESVIATAQLAVAMARASATVPQAQPASMAPSPACTDTIVSPCLEDPFAVPNAEKADLLLSACDRMLNVQDVVMAWGMLHFIRMRRVIGNTDGSRLDLTHTVSHPMLEAVAAVGGESQVRNYTDGASQAGYEFIRSSDLLGNSERWAEEAVMKCKADDCPVGKMDLVLSPSHLALTIHESVGHPTELDRILGWEANMAGKSFVEPGFVGEYQYGSDIINFTAGNELVGGLGTWGYDDDGVKLHDFPVVRNGKLVALGCTRETAPLVGWSKSNGCCRADGFASVPINRIPNLYLEPGTDDSVTADDLIADVERGIYIEGRGSFSIDQMRNNFQFGGDLFWLIEGGKRVRPLKKVTYQSQTTSFWRSCDGMAGRHDWRPFGLMNCGKGEPGQVMRMTHGASTCRFRNIDVGGAKL
ncbi:MAG: TldD/PmbA family protein [bacterium]|nr:TldD/PmbA family protein [bacterium]